jgi:sirohydrochlorin ferrochelatase
LGVHTLKVLLQQLQQTTRQQCHHLQQQQQQLKVVVQRAEQQHQEQLVVVRHRVCASRGAPLPGVAAVVVHSSRAVAAVVVAVAV